MVRTRAVVTDDAAPIAGVARGRGRGRRGARVAATAPTRAVVEEQPVALVGGQAGLIPVAADTSQTGGGTQTSSVCTLEQRVHVGQVPGVMATQPMVPVQPAVRATASEEEQLRLERFKKYDPPTFSCLASESAHGFLEECHRILRTMGIVETSGVVFTTFQLIGAAYQWWRAYELEFEQLRQGSMTMSEYTVRFSDLDRHELALVATVRERVRRFIERLNPCIRFSMAQ
ncbi:uncharacterized protein [Nicotiana tomentosiformis]|uniref:uncharacterized protein n=1 Tax=Nicotiana tomentosiformis TaxID=4098 RepID=UPI00388CACCF